uniref:Uncharacterized protein n=1 Tax=Arundo donax TaxID=35708 RepID=A0A0A8YXF8_ARUDO
MAFPGYLFHQPKLSCCYLSGCLIFDSGSSFEIYCPVHLFLYVKIRSSFEILRYVNLFLTVSN